MKTINKLLSLVGGKRGLAVIIGAFGTIAVQAGWISPDAWMKIGDAAIALGFTGIIHQNFKA